MKSARPHDSTTTACAEFTYTLAFSMQMREMKRREATCIVVDKREDLTRPTNSRHDSSSSTKVCMHDLQQ